MNKYSIGLDFGTNSCRSLIIDLESGEELAFSIFTFPDGEDGVITDKTNPRLARQNPNDYLKGIYETVTQAIKIAKERDYCFSPLNIIGIGVDATSCSPMPVDEKGMPLCFNEKFKDDPNAMVWLWKDHTSLNESEQITKLAQRDFPHYLSNIGGSYSSEWFWSKLWHLQKISPQLFQQTYTFVEVCDWIPYILTGQTSPKKIKRSACAAGHKAMFNKEWNGLPSKEFLSKLSPELSEIREKLYNTVYPAGKLFGNLSGQWASKLGLSDKVAVSVGIVDAHAGAIGAGVREGRLVKILGTSACDILIHNKTSLKPNILGISGIVSDSVIKGYYGIEAGQPAVGDIFTWFVHNYVPNSYGTTKTEKFLKLEMEAEKLKPGESGLLALDWNNGNRNILSDSRLSGLLIGQTLHTKAHEVYRSLIEATAFGSLTIINKLEEYGIKIDEITACGGLSVKNQLLLQIYSDVIGREVRLAKSKHTSALGSAILGAVAAGKLKGGFKSIEEAQTKLTSTSTIIKPNHDNYEVYQQLYKVYKSLHDAFGIKKNNASVYSVMKKLIEIEENVL